MPHSLQLDPADRRFFALVTRAVVTNAFGRERAAVELEIAGLTEPEATGSEIGAAIRTVTQRLAALESSGCGDLPSYSGEDREHLKFTHLFDAYYRSADRFDEHILDQVKSGGEEVLPIEFARKALADLERRGFSPPEAERYFALFFQLRRAFHFVDRSLIGVSDCMRNLRERLWNNVFTSDLRTYDAHLSRRMEDFSTLLLGETGTGKGSAAAAIGRSGFIPFKRRQGRFAESFTRAFVSVNLAEFSEPLIESELFGHQKGAFTGAIDRHVGVLASCSPHGSILLDEIGDIPVSIQIKLLRVLQERSFTPVGSRTPARFHGRVIGATNRSQDSLRGEGGLRDDLYYRLCSDEIVVPPLRTRLREEPRELELLVAGVLERLLDADVPELAASIASALVRDLPLDYAWPGNVRELEQAIRRVLLDGAYGGGSPTEGRIEEHERNEGWTDLLASGLDARGLLATYCGLLYRHHGSYERVARVTRLDRRTVKKYVGEGEQRSSRTS